MNTRIAALQIWLNSKGANIKADGKGGPATRTAIIETFRNRSAGAITIPEIKMIADRLGCSVRQLSTVAKVESAGGGWDDSGLLKCLWERHYLWRRIKIAVPFLSNPSPGGYTVDADHDGINDSWEKLADAAIRWGDIAFECASFGKFQVMGAHAVSLGYYSAMAMVWDMSRAELAQYQVLAKFIERNGLIPAIRGISDHPSDCLPFALGYNGKGQQGYDRRLAAAFGGK